MSGVALATPVMGAPEGIAEGMRIATVALLAMDLPSLSTALIDLTAEKSETLSAVTQAPSRTEARSAPCGVVW